MISSTRRRVVTLRIVSWRFCGSPKLLLTHSVQTYSLHYLAYLLTYLLAPWSRVLLAKLTSSQLVTKLPLLIEPKASLSHLQVPTNCPYPEPARSSPCPHIPFPEEPFYYYYYYYPAIYVRVFRVISFPQISHLSKHLSSSPFALHAPPISFFSILSHEHYWVSSTDH